MKCTMKHHKGFVDVTSSNIKSKQISLLGDPFQGILGFRKVVQMGVFMVLGPGDHSLRGNGRC